MSTTLTSVWKFHVFRISNNKDASNTKKSNCFKYWSIFIYQWFIDLSRNLIGKIEVFPSNWENSLFFDCIFIYFDFKYYLEIFLIDLLVYVYTMDLSFLSLWESYIYEAAVYFNVNVGQLSSCLHQTDLRDQNKSVHNFLKRRYKNHFLGLYI